MLLHQLPPGSAAATTPPAPAVAKGIERQALICGTGSGEDGAGLQHLRQFPRPLLSKTAVAPEQRDDPLPLRIEDKNGWILLLALNQRGDQPGHGTDRANEQQGLSNPPVIAGALFDRSIRADGLVDLGRFATGDPAGVGWRRTGRCRCRSEASVVWAKSGRALAGKWLRAA